MLMRLNDGLPPDTGSGARRRAALRLIPTLAALAALSLGCSKSLGIDDQVYACETDAECGSGFVCVDDPGYVGRVCLPLVSDAVGMPDLTSSDATADSDAAGELDGALGDGTSADAPDLNADVPDVAIPMCVTADDCPRNADCQGGACVCPTSGEACDVDLPNVMAVQCLGPNSSICGVLGCADGFSDCNDDASDGCENECGACCPAGSTCTPEGDCRCGGTGQICGIRGNECSGNECLCNGSSACGSPDICTPDGCDEQ